MIRQRIGKLLNGMLSPLGLKLIRLASELPGDLSHDEVFRRLARRNPLLGTIIDVGASDGCWSQRAAEFWPSAHLLLLEGNPAHEPQLQAFVQQQPNRHYALSVVSDQPGAVFFDDSDPWCGVASHAPVGGAVKSFPATTIDREVQKLGLQGPFLVKLDTHGFEVPILEGAAETLREAQWLIIETYNFQVSGQSLRFWEICTYRDKKGFRPVDFLDPMHRPVDGALWQVDIVFARVDDPVFERSGYD